MVIITPHLEVPKAGLGNGREHGSSCRAVGSRIFGFKA